MQCRASKCCEKGFTLVELLVSIGIIAILIGILLPALGGVKVRSSEVKALNDLRQTGFTIQLYVDDSKGMYPYFPPDTPHLIGPPDQPLGIIFVNDDPWSMRYMWPTVMHRVASWSDHYETWNGVGQESGELPWLSISGTWMFPSYQMSNSFVASPHTWSGSGVAQVQPTRAGQVRYPSAKAMFFDLRRPYLRNPEDVQHTRGVLFTDGSARGVFDADAAEPVQNRLTDRAPNIYHDTPEGIHGRDIE